MKLKHLALATLLGLAGATTFAGNTAQVTVTATVTSEATITNMPSTLDFGSVVPSTLASTDITSTPVNVNIYDNNIGTGTQISTTCSKGDETTGNGCYICTGANCTPSTQVLLKCTYTPCGTNSTPMVITPDTNSSKSGYVQTIPAANSSPAACQAQSGSFTCSLNKTGQMNTSGSYSGNLNLTVSDGA